MATGPDPDAPVWFEPEPAGDNGAAEVMLAVAPVTGERSEEREVVYTDDLSPDDNVGGGATADTEAEIIEASREFNDAAAPEFQGDVPGFTDWREELRERLKRIRARREQERLAEAGTDEAAVAVAEGTLEEDAETVAEEPAADVDGPAAATIPDNNGTDEAPREETGVGTEAPLQDDEPKPIAMPPAGGLDGDLDLAPQAESVADIDFTLDEIGRAHV